METRSLICLPVLPTLHSTHLREGGRDRRENWTSGGWVEEGTIVRGKMMREGMAEEDRKVEEGRKDGVRERGWTISHFLPGWSCLNWTTVMVKTHFSLLPASSAAWWGWGLWGLVGLISRSVDRSVGWLVIWMIRWWVDHLVSRLVVFSVSWPVN